MAELDPSMCACHREKDNLAKVINAWRARARPRLLALLKAGQRIDFNQVKHEAQLAASLGRGGKTSLLSHNLEYGHLCDECPYRQKNPLKKDLAQK